LLTRLSENITAYVGETVKKRKSEKASVKLTQCTEAIHQEKASASAIALYNTVLNLLK